MILQQKINNSAVCTYFLNFEFFCDKSQDVNPCIHGNDSWNNNHKIFLVLAYPKSGLPLLYWWY